MTLTLWNFWTLDGLLCGPSHLHITAPPADKQVAVFFLMIEPEMHSRERLLFFCFWLMVKRHGCKPLQGRNYATFQRKCMLCLKSDSQYQIDIWKMLHEQYVGRGVAYWIKFRRDSITMDIATCRCNQEIMQHLCMPFTFQSISAYLIHMVLPRFKRKDWKFCNACFNIFLNDPCTWSHMLGF